VVLQSTFYRQSSLPSHKTGFSFTKKKQLLEHDWYLIRFYRDKAHNQIFLEEEAKLKEKITQFKMQSHI